MGRADRCAPSPGREEGAGVSKILCWLLGHPDSTVLWGPWQDDPDVGRHRVFTEQCVRCGAVLALLSMLEDQPWTP